jgi:hypothetical protein
MLPPLPSGPWMLVGNRFGGCCAVDDCCCIAVCAAILEAESVTSDRDAVGRDGSKKPCEWCRGRCLDRSGGTTRPEVFLLVISFWGIKDEADGRLGLSSVAPLPLVLEARGIRGEEVPGAVPKSLREL